MRKLETYATVKDGTLKISHREIFQENVRQMPSGRYLLTLEKLYSKRSSPQNRYYWGVMIPAVQRGFLNLGYELTKDECHEFLKNRFLEKRRTKQIVNRVTGEVEMIGILTTKDLTTTEFDDYKDEIQHFAAEFLGENIPDPGEQSELEL